MTMSYDRTAEANLLLALKPEGWAHSLVKFGQSSGYALDLQLRGYANKSNETWATLYVGLTKVLDLRFLPSKGFRLRGHKNYATSKYGWNSSWGRSWYPGDSLSEEWREVDLYLERVIPRIGNPFLVEGAVQAAVSGFKSEHMVVIDREAAVTYSNEAEKRRINSRLARPLLKAVDDLRFPSKPLTLGGECDALAIARDGTLLAIEIKPWSATSSIRWSPLQARHYANLFSEWIYGEDGVGDETAKEVIEKMVAQRKRLGLVTKNVNPLKLPIQVRPLIAIGRGYSEAAYEGLTTVQQRLADAGCNDPPLRVMRAKMWGELDVITP